MLRDYADAKPGEFVILEPGCDIAYVPSGPLPLDRCEVCGESMMDVTAMGDDRPRYLCPNDHEVRPRWCDLCHEHHMEPCPWPEIESKYEGVG